MGRTQSAQVRGETLAAIKTATFWLQLLHAEKKRFVHRLYTAHAQVYTRKNVALLQATTVVYAGVFTLPTALSVRLNVLMEQMSLYSSHVWSSNSLLLGDVNVSTAAQDRSAVSTRARSVECLVRSRTELCSF